MNHHARTALVTPETYVLVLALWYVLLLSLGIPTLPGWAHVASAIAFGGVLVGIALSALRLDRDASRKTISRLTGLFVVGIVAASAVTAATPLTIETFMKSTLVGKLIIAIVGACLFGGITVGIVTIASGLFR